jgi:hypothetical protein
MGLEDAPIERPRSVWDSETAISSMVIDYISPRSVFLLFGSFLIAQFTLVFVAQKYPSIRTTRTIDWVIEPPNSGGSMQVVLKLTPISQYHDQLQLAVTMSRFPNAVPDPPVVAMRMQIEFLGEQTRQKTIERKIQYHPTRLEAPIDLLSTQLPECHSVVISMDIELDFSYYSAIRFSYSVVDAKFGEIMNSIRILLFACVGYAFVSFLSTLTIGFKSKIQYFALFFGPMGLLATNPFLLSIDGPVQKVCFAIFAAGFRLFVVVFLCEIQALVYCFLPFLFCFCGLEILGAMTVRWFHGFWTIAVVWLLIVSYKGKDGVDQRKTVAMAPFFFWTLIIPLVTEVLVPMLHPDRNVSFSVLLYDTCHIMCAIAVMFLVPTVSIENQPAADDGPQMVAIDVISDDDHLDDSD